jgi:tripartite-type tricarboxylate transporter receptor subunit TctC
VNKMRFFIALCIGVLAWGAFDVHAQSRTVRIVVPYAPGGAPDALTRMLAEHISKTQGASMVIENRPGAGAIVGTDAVMRAAPDGNTLLVVANAFLTNPHLRKVNYDPLTNFEPICQLVSVPALIVVAGSSPYRSLGDLLDAARANPGKVTLASPGPATTFHIAYEMLRRTAGIEMTYVPYPGTPPALTALVGGHVASVFSYYASMAGQLKAGAIRALATAGPARLAALPDVPTVAESGFKDYESEVWFGMVAPAKVPNDTTAELIAWFSAALRADDVRPKLLAQGLNPVGRCGVEFAAYLRTQYNTIGRTIRDANIKAE